MKTHVFGEPSALFADPPKDLIRVADETALGRLLQDREVVVVADAALLPKMSPALATVLLACPAAVIVAGKQEDAGPALAAFPTLPAVLTAPLSTLALDRASKFARDLARRRSTVSTLESQLARRNAELSELNKIGAALSAERDIKRLLTLILNKSLQITAADAGSLYLCLLYTSDAADE